MHRNLTKISAVGVPVVIGALIAAAPSQAADAVGRSATIESIVCASATTAHVDVSYTGPAGTFANVVVNAGRVSSSAPLGAVVFTVSAEETWDHGNFGRATNGDSQHKTVRVMSAGQVLDYWQFDFVKCRGL